MSFLPMNEEDYRDMMEGDRPATMSEAVGEWARNCEAPADREWLLHDRDVWVRNPRYTGPRGPHPEEFGYDDPEEWSGSPDPDDPDNFWIDDATGERVNAETGERTPPPDPAQFGLDEWDDLPF